MERTEQYYKEKIAEEIKRILSLEQNKKAAEKFWQTLDKVNAKSCTVKIGWRSGEAISILCAYEKSGNLNTFDLFIENINNVGEIFGFLCGLNPETFLLDSKHIIDSDTHFFIDFKFQRDEQ